MFKRVLLPFHKEKTKSIKPHMTIVIGFISRLQKDIFVSKEHVCSHLKYQVTLEQQYQLSWYTANGILVRSNRNVTVHRSIN